ncbi:DUF1330 domain-containing protein [Derxia lacustris]|uniref:DUF1330 domain-containing protein n=1 Tax=Derxia lacustris TaxID=764842 RepID=UPI000A1771F6|nr:DUF1330 domain-containing protein [Derxia lacustris]
MPAYVVVSIDVKKPAQYAEYQKLAKLAATAYDAKPLVRGGRMEVLEGPAPQRMAILQFPSMPQARAWYDSPQYKRARNVRGDAAAFSMVIVEGF